MRRAHDEAVDAIFGRKVKAHHHMQAYISRKTGKTKWGELEMWPVHVSLSAEKRKEKKTRGKKRKRKENTTPFGVNLMRSPVLDRAAQGLQSYTLWAMWSELAATCVLA